MIHFTILRPPEAQDFTPVNELSLIAFPIRELFEVKLNEFDLDHLRSLSPPRPCCPQIYLDNITRWVRGGGALLLAVRAEPGPVELGLYQLADSRQIMHGRTDRPA